MATSLSIVRATGTGCLIGREPSGAYVVWQEQLPGTRLRVPTLPCAYAACRAWERGNDGEGLQAPPG
jgi:hypothetical protein